MVCECAYSPMTFDQLTIHSADAWSRWEQSTAKLKVDPAYIAKADDPKWSVSLSTSMAVSSLTT